MPPSLDKIIYESANVLQRKASSDEEVVAKIKALDPLTEVCIRKLPYEKSDPTNPVWRAIRDSGIIGLLLDFATTGKKGDGSFAIMNATNRLRIFCLGQLYEIIVRLELLLDYNEELVDDLVERVPRILEIFELAIQDRDPPGRLALLRLPLLFIVGALAAPRTIDIIDEQYKLLQSNCDTMSWLVFAPLFNDRSALVGIDSFRVTMALGILRSYDGLCINPTTDIIDEAISRYGLVEIVEDSIYLCNRFGSSGEDLMLGTRVLILQLLEDPRFHRPLIASKRVHQILVNCLWDIYRKTTVKHDVLHQRGYELGTTLLKRFQKYLKDDQDLWKLIIRELVVEGDLLSLIAMIALWSEDSEYTERDARAFVEAVATHCRRPSPRLKLRLQTEWSHISRSLRAYVSPGEMPMAPRTRVPFQPLKGLAIWNELGSKLGFISAGASFRDPDHRTNCEETNSREGCSWIRCPLFGESPHFGLESRIMSWSCSRCRRVTYCSFECQKRDWKEGSHRTTCNRRTD